MRVLLLIGCAVLIADWLMATGHPQYDFPDPVYQTYGPDLLHHGFCPREPKESLCDANFCTQDNHCEEASKKCCPAQCGGLMCLDAVPGQRRDGECPDFWKVPVENYPNVPINECDIDTDCTAVSNHKCCGTTYASTRKCVLPKA